MDETFEDRVADILHALRRGDVISYGEVASEAGSPGAARAVGSVLRRGLQDAPWWRVVRADGRLGAPDVGDQAARLRVEGVRVVDGRVIQASRRRGSVIDPTPP